MEDCIFSVRLFLIGFPERYVHQNPVSLSSLVEALLVVLYSPLSSPFVHRAFRYIVIVFVVHACPSVRSPVAPQLNSQRDVFSLLFPQSPTCYTVFKCIPFPFPGCLPSFSE